MKRMIKIDNLGQMSPSCLLLNPYLPLTLPLRAPKRMMYLFAVLAMLLLGGWNTQAWAYSSTKLIVNISGGGKVAVTTSNSEPSSYSSSTVSAQQGPHGLFDTDVEDTYYVWVSPNSGYHCSSVTDGTKQSNGSYMVKAPGNWSKNNPNEKSVTATFVADFYGRADSYSSPSDGGGTYVSCNGNKPSQASQYITHDKSTFSKTGQTSAPACSAYFAALASDGYEFVGWYTGENGTGTKKSANISYTENISIAATSTSSNPTSITRYAYFKPLQYYYFKAQANKVGNGTVYASFSNSSYTAATATKSERATKLSQTQSTITPTAYFKAVESDANYHFAGWYTDAACTEANRVSTDLEYSVAMGKSNKTSEATALTQTLYAKFVQELTPEITATGYVEANPKTMEVGDNIESAFSFLNTSPIGFGLTVTSSNTGVLVYDAGLNKISAVGEGTATITFTQSYTGIIKAKTFTFNFSVSRIENNLALTVSEFEMFVDDELGQIINGEHIAIASRNNTDISVTVTSSDPDLIRYDASSDKIIVPNDKEDAFVSKKVNLVFSQPQTYKYTAASETIVMTVKKYQPTISVNKIALELEQTATLTTTNTTADLNVTIEPATGVLNYANGTFTAVGLGDATVTVTQPEVRTTSYKQEVYNFHVSKKTPTLVVKMDGTAATSKSVTRGTVVNVAFEENSDADVVVTNVSGAQYASYINGVMTAGAVGTATYRASLAETDTYQAKTVDFSLTVTGTPSDHVPYTNTDGFKLGSGSATDWTPASTTIHFTGIPDKLSFNYAFHYIPFDVFGIHLGDPSLKCPDGLKWAIDDGKEGNNNVYMLYVEESADNSNWHRIWDNSTPSANDAYQPSGTIQLNKTTRYIRFHHSCNFSNTYKDINITELKYVENPDPASIDFGSAIINSGNVSSKVLVNWCNIAPLTVTSSNNRFSVTPTSFGNFEKYGSQELTIRFSHEEEGSFSGDITISNGVDAYTKTIHVTAETTKRPQTITWNSDLVATGYAMNVGEQYPDEVITTIATATNGGNITYTSDNTNVIEVIDGVSLSAVGTGKANITAYQAGDDDFKEVYDTKEFTVTELQKQVITWNQNLYGLLTTSGNVTLNATATSGMAITYESADKNVVRVEGNTLIVVGEGETYITASQVGGKDANDVEWLPISQNNYVIVRDPNSQCNGMALSIGSLTLNSGKPSTDYDLSGIPSVLSFIAKHGTKKGAWGTAPSYSSLIVEQYAYINNLWDWYEVYNQVVGTGDTQSGNIALDESATKIRFKTLETGTDHTISNIRVTRPKFMNSDVSKVDQEVETNALWQQTVTISHSNIDVMSITTKRGLLSLSTSSLGDGCEDFGEDQFVVSYTPMQKDAEYLDTVVITDSKAEPTTITIPIRLYTKGWTQEIENFNLPAAALTTDALPALTATATSELDVRYESSNENIVRIVNGNELEIITSGTVTIKAIQDGNNRYYETYAEKSITISKAVPALIAPVGTDVTYLAALSTSSLSGGSATVTLRGAENTTVEGTFAWTNPAQQITDNVDAHSYSVTFTPNDEAYYAPATIMVEINVVAATSVVTPSASHIIYGQKMNVSVLTNSGTEGTWTWTDTRANEVLPAGTYDDLAVHFTPSSTNYTELDGIVTLTVKKATPVVTPAATAIEQGQTVSQSVLSTATGNIPGTWTWHDDDADNKPEQGKYTYHVDFTPDDANNYNALTGIPVTLTVNMPSTFVFSGKGDWTADGNWNTGTDPSEQVDVIVDGNVVISTSVTVGSLTINEGSTVTLTETGSLTLGNEASEDRTAYGDLHVEAGGQVILGNGALKVHDFILDASLGGLDAEAHNKTAMSGQVTNAEKIEKQGNAYFDLSFDPSGKISYGWYDFTVPFEVNIAGGIYRINSTSDKVMVCGTDFLIMEADEVNRANGGKGWRQFRTGVLKPGKLYTITFDDEVNQNTFRFMWNGNGSLSNGETYNAQFAAGSEESLRGWNGMGNGMLRHGYPKGNYKMQMYNHSTNTYDLVSGKNTFAVGSAFFVQVNAAGEIDWEKAAATADRPLYAPSRVGYEVEEFCLSLRQEDANAAADVLYFSASEEATEAYVIGHDLLKMGTPTDSKVARLWATKGGKKLCDVEAGLANNNAEAPLSIYAPQTGTYILSADEAPANTSLYLTYNGRVIWNLSYTPYTLDLTKGTTEGYGIKLYVNRITTDIEEVQGDGAQCTKVLMDNKIYIIMPNGAMYDATGKKVQ